MKDISTGKVAIEPVEPVHSNDESEHVQFTSRCGNAAEIANDTIKTLI